MKPRREINLVPLMILIVLSIAFTVAIRQLDSQEAAPTAPVPSAAVVQTAPPETYASRQATAMPSDAPLDAPSDGALIGDRDAVAAHIREHGELPDYYITKREAERLGWQGGSLEPYAPGKMIGGDRFGNYEELLPKKAGRVWTECDIGSFGSSSRGAKRIVYSNDGLIYYTDDHYASFVRLEGGG